MSMPPPSGDQDGPAGAAGSLSQRRQADRTEADRTEAVRTDERAARCAVESGTFSVGRRAGRCLLTSPWWTGSYRPSKRGRWSFATCTYRSTRTCCLLYTSPSPETRHDLVCRLLLEKKKKK